jgi:anti-sigma factor RsiW
MKWHWHRCRRREDISLLAAGALSGGEKIQAEQHLAACQECQSHYGEIKNLTAPLAIWEKNLSAIEATPASQRRWAKALQECGSGVPPLVPSSHRKPSLQSAWRIIWRELLWPSRYAWSGMAALWVGMLIINGQLSDQRMRDTGTRVASTQDMIQNWQEQIRVLAELAQPTYTVPAPPPYLPRPRSHREQNRAMI